MAKPAPTAASPGWSRRTLIVARALLALAALGIYANSLRLPFVFDDRLAIEHNLSIRRLASLSDVLVPPSNGGGSAGRPVVNLTLAFNYAISGESTWSYHAFNILIHVVAGLVLFGLLRRTLRRPVLPPAIRSSADALGFVVAGLWIVHPLQTESVTCVIQRTESLVSLFYLLTFYGFARAADSPRPAAWRAGSIVACLLGMATKEVMVTAPVLLWAYDRTFLAGSFRAAWRARRGYYAGLAATWLLLAALLVHGGGGRATGAGFGLGVTPWAYALTQCRAVLLYLKLAVWPHPLVLDYGMGVARGFSEVAPEALLLVALLAGTLLAWLQRPALGFLAAAFFVILAPSSSVVPLVGQTMAEHRMYLPLAPVLVLLVLALRRMLGRFTWAFLAAVALTFAGLTVMRNRDYRSEFNLWEDVARKFPESARGQFNYANELARFPARLPEALAHYEAAIDIKPDYIEAHYNLAGQLIKLPGRTAEAIEHYRRAIAGNPGYAEAHNNLGVALEKVPGRRSEAIAEYETALRLKPDYVEAHLNLGAILASIPGRTPGAIAHYEAALRLKPGFAAAHNNLAAALATIPGRQREAIEHYRKAIELEPAYAEAHNNLALELAKSPESLPEAISHYETALRLQPGYAEAHCNLGAALAPLPGRLPEAIRHFEAAVKLDPTYLQARSNLARALSAAGRPDEAAAQLEAILAQDPNQSDARRRLDAIRGR